MQNNNFCSEHADHNFSSINKVNMFISEPLPKLKVNIVIIRCLKTSRYLIYFKQQPLLNGIFNNLNRLSQSN